MSSCSYRLAASFVVAALMVLQAEPVRAQGNPPADTYFSLAVTENSHNHAGAKLLYLDFQAAPYAPVDPTKGEVLSVEAPATGITLDGLPTEWDPTTFTLVPGLVQSNYPLSEYIDAVPTDIIIGSAWDATHAYFVVQWVDAGHDASRRLKKWIYGDQGSGEAGWNQSIHKGATLGAPNASAVNASGHVLSGLESEDRVFFMFPIVDTQGNYAPGGSGCATYCHTNLSADDPYQGYTGNGVVAMHTNVPGDTADIWHWKAARTEPSGVADDKYLAYALGSTSGRLSDAGTAAYSGNGLVGSNPGWMHTSGLGYLGDFLLSAQAVSYSGTAVQGDEIPRYRSVSSTGSRGDVATAGQFDASTSTWTVEFRRLRDTGNSDDHSFDGTPAAPPTEPLVQSTSTFWGRLSYEINCLACHGPDGEGVFGNGYWAIPRVQRASGSQIHTALSTVFPMMGLAGSLTPQDLEDIASYLQTKHIPAPTPAYAQTFGTACGGLSAGWTGIPFLGSSAFGVTLSGATPNTPATLYIGFSNTSWLGLPLPYDLTPAGAPGCNVLVSLDQSLEFTTDASGNATAMLPIPVSFALVGLTAHAQWAVDSTSNALGLIASNAVTAIIQP